jgi:hypothetical protein
MNNSSWNTGDQVVVGDGRSAVLASKSISGTVGQRLLLMGWGNVVVGGGAYVYLYLRKDGQTTSSMGQAIIKGPGDSHMGFNIQGIDAIEDADTHTYSLETTVVGGGAVFQGNNQYGLSIITVGPDFT